MLNNDRGAYSLIWDIDDDLSRQLNMSSRFLHFTGQYLSAISHLQDVAYNIHNRFRDRL